MRLDSRKKVVFGFREFDQQINVASRALGALGIGAEKPDRQQPEPILQIRFFST